MEPTARPSLSGKATKLWGSLCFSNRAAAAELALAFQSSIQTVLTDFPVSACDARRSSREPVRGGANSSGLRFIAFSLGCKSRWYWPAGKAAGRSGIGLLGGMFLA